MGRKLVFLLMTLTAATLVVLMGVWALADSGRDFAEVVVAILAMVTGSLVTPSVSSRNRLTLTISAAASLPFVFTLGSEDRVDLGPIIGIYLVSALVIAAVDVARTGAISASLEYAGRQFVGYATFAMVFTVIRGLVGESFGTSGLEILVPFVAAGASWIAVAVFLWSLAIGEESRISSRYAALSGLKDVNVFISLVATGGLFGLMYDGLEWWALPVALLPYAFAHVAFRRFHETKATYRQTIRALAQIPEAAGLNLGGHSDRTAELAVAMAKDLGLTPEEVEDVEFAALMHDIGHITLNDPTVIEHGWTDDDLARWGAEIIAGAPSLDRVSSYVRRQYEPFRKPGEESDPTVPRVARIVKIASAFDSHRMGRGVSQLEALEELHQGAAYEYDPEVVASLRRVLDGGGKVTA